VGEKGGGDAGEEEEGDIDGLGGREGGRERLEDEDEQMERHKLIGKEIEKEQEGRSSSSKSISYLKICNHLLLSSRSFLVYPYSIPSPKYLPIPPKPAVASPEETTPVAPSLPPPSPPRSSASSQCPNQNVYSTLPRPGLHTPYHWA